LPVVTAAPPEVVPVLPTRPVSPARPPQPSRGNRVVRGFAAFFGLLWRLGVGALMCFNTYILSYLTSIIAVGWTYRWMQAVVLRGWWKQSPKQHAGSFRDFC